MSERAYIDLPDRLPIDVTADDLATGRPAVAAHCAIALAAKRALGLPASSDAVSVCDGQLTVWSGRMTRDYDLGDGAVLYAEQFDLSREGWTRVPAPAPRAFVGVLLPPPRIQPEEASP